MGVHRTQPGKKIHGQNYGEWMYRRSEGLPLAISPTVSPYRWLGKQHEHVYLKQLSNLWGWGLVAAFSDSVHACKMCLVTSWGRYAPSHTVDSWTDSKELAFLHVWFVITCSADTSSCYPMGHLVGAKKTDTWGRTSKPPRDRLVHQKVHRRTATAEKDIDAGSDSPSSRYNTWIWIPPESGVCKINIDGAVSRDGIKGSFSVVAWNHTGDYMGSSAVMIEWLSDPGILKTLACREGLSLASDLNLSQVNIATDWSVDHLSDEGNCRK